MDKFKPKKTSDDCYAPGPVYDAVADWVAREFGLDRERFLRPFYPGGDYQREEYPEGFVVVNTSFITNLDREHRIRCEPELYSAVTRADTLNRKAAAKTEKPKYRYPDCVATAAGLKPLARAGARFAVPKEETAFTRALDAQRAQGKALFGGGFLLSSRAAAERAAAERAAAEERIEWTLSERERESIRWMDERVKRREDMREGRGRKEETELAAEPGLQTAGGGSGPESGQPGAAGAGLPG